MRPLPAALLVLFATTVGCGLLTDFGGLSNPPDEPTVTDAAVAREDAAAAREDASAPDAEPGALPTYVAEVLKDQPITYLRFEEPSGAGVIVHFGAPFDGVRYLAVATDGAWKIVDFPLPR